MMRLREVTDVCLACEGLLFGLFILHCFFYILFYLTYMTNSMREKMHEKNPQGQKDLDLQLKFDKLFI